MSKHGKNQQHQQRPGPRPAQNQLTGSGGIITPSNTGSAVMTEEELNALQEPTTGSPIPSIAPAETGDGQDNLTATTTDGVENDPSVTGSQDAQHSDDAIVLQIEDASEVQMLQIDPQQELQQARTEAFKQVRIRPRVSMRMRVPHPTGRQSLWLNLVAGKEMIVASYVRDWLFEKGMI